LINTVLASSDKWTDPDFPPELSSLYNEQGQVDADTIPFYDGLSW